MTFILPQVKPVRAKPARKRRNSIETIDVLVFLIPCLQLIRIKVVGVLNGSDLMMVAVFLYLAFRSRLRIATPVGKWSLVLCALWLASQCMTDLVRHSAFADYARGWSNVGLTLVSLAVLWTLLYGRPKRLETYGWGLVIGSIVYLLVNPNEAMTGGAPGDIWKFGLAYPVSLGVFLLASRKECRGYWPIILAVMMGVINMAQGSRNAGGECLAAALYLFVTSFSRRKNPDGSRLRPRTVVALAACILLSVAGVIWIYGRAASTGVLGEKAQETYEQESSGKYGVLLGGRTEMLSTLPAIYDSPILGHGSWAKEPIYIIEQHQALLLLGYKFAAQLITPEDLREGLIPTHSYFFGAWVDAGILGAVFWAWIFILAARVLLRVYPANTVLLPAMAYLVFLLLWNVPFSPYGTQERITFPYTLVLMMTLMDTASGKAVRVPANKMKRKIQTTLAPRPQY